MGTKYKEVNTLSFIGNVGPKTERVWKEVDEEQDIIACKEKHERACQLITPLKLLQQDLLAIPTLIGLCHLRGSLDALILCPSEGKNHFCNTAQLSSYQSL